MAEYRDAEGVCCSPSPQIPVLGLHVPPPCGAVDPLPNFVHTAGVFRGLCGPWLAGSKRRGLVSWAVRFIKG